MLGQLILESADIIFLQDINWNKLQRIARFLCGSKKLWKKWLGMTREDIWNKLCHLPEIKVIEENQCFSLFQGAA